LFGDTSLSPASQSGRAARRKQPADHRLRELTCCLPFLRCTMHPMRTSDRPPLHPLAGLWCSASGSTRICWWVEAPPPPPPPGPNCRTCVEGGVHLVRLPNRVLRAVGAFAGFGRAGQPPHATRNCKGMTQPGAQHPRCIQEVTRSVAGRMK
jgi:hypothetical protein